jgi:hypothetical protein
MAWPLWSDFLLAPHKPADQIDSNHPVICRFCGAVKPHEGGWLGLCLQPIYGKWR